VSRRRRSHRIVFVAGLVLLLAPGAARAQHSPKEQCASAFDHAQDLRDEGKLLEARAALVVCERTCPPTLTPDCALWRREVDALIPSVFVSANGARGERISDVRLRIDGRNVTEPLDAAIELDPGPHTFVFQRPDRSHVDVAVSLQKSEKGRRVVATFLSDAASASAVRAPLRSGLRPPPPAAYVIGGLGLLALAASAVLTIKGHVDRQALFHCEPNCSVDDADAIRVTWDVAGALAAVGAVGLGVAGFVWATSPAPSSPSPNAGGVVVGGRF